MTGEAIVRVTLYPGEALFLGKEEQELGRFIGDCRHGIDVRLGYTPRVVQNLTTVWSNHRFGGMAEVALARKLNLYPMMQFRAFLDYNVRLASGELVNTKHDREGRCLVDVEREASHRRRGNEPPDLHIVLTGDGKLTADGKTDGEVPSLTYVGWATHAEALAAPVEELGDYPPAHVLRALHPVLQIVTCARGAGWREGVETSRFEYFAQ